MASNYYIITGSSRGLGASLSRLLLHKDNAIYCLSRTENEEMASAARNNECIYSYHSIDLASPFEASKVLHDIVACIPLAEAGTITLINNAATVTPIKDLFQCTDEEIVTNVNTNLTSPAILISTFIRLTADTLKTRTVVNITSGSAHYPSDGMSLYCSTKAGFNMLTQCVALERHPINPVNIVAVDPGMMDTLMQETAREAEFGLSGFFHAQKDAGRLRSTDSVAREIVSGIGKWKSGQIVKIGED